MSKQVDELTALIEDGGVNIKDLAKIAKMLKNGEIEKTELAKKSRAKSIPSLKWEVSLCNYPDFAIKRTTKQTEQLLVIMPSCAGYYIKYKNGDNEIIEELTPELYSKFTTGMSTIKLDDEMWIHTIEAGKTFYGYLEKAIKSNDYIAMVKKHCAPQFEDVFTCRYNDEARYIRCYNAYPNLYEQYAREERILRNFLLNSPMTSMLIEKFGLDNIRNFIEEFKLSLVRDTRSSNYGTYYENPFSSYNMQRILESYNFDYKTFRDYVLYQSVRMGYGCALSRFWDDWKDTLDMQQRMYGKIKEKYPDDLPLYHQRLSYKAIINAEEIDAKALTRVVEKLSKYDMNVGDFVFMCPKSQQDMTDEAQQQANCLASYIQKYINGESEIFFMRKKDDPETSYITIEKAGYELRQIYYACNRRVSDEDREVAMKWLKKCEKIDKGEKENVDDLLQTA